jgi:membrane protein DedA with SNARE-associated domain
MHLESLSQMLSAGSGSTTYVALVLLLYLTSVGLPLPEEITLITAGALVYEGAMHMPYVLLFAALAVVSADVQIYYIGRHFGRRIFEHRIFSRLLLTPERFAKAEQRFAGHSMWAIFTVRFISGLRWPTYFTAGTLRTPAYKFILIDAAATSIHVTAYTLVGYLFGPHVDDIVTFIKKADKWIATGALLMLVMVAVLIAYRLGKRRQRKIDKVAAAPVGEAPAEQTRSTGDGV